MESRKIDCALGIPFTPFEIEASWKEVLKDELEKPYIVSLAAFVERERLAHPPIYPPKELVFNAFFQTPYRQVKVVIMGQDPYHGAGQAHGLCFSVPKGVAFPPSLQNIFKELVDDLDLPYPQHGCLLSWAQQGVMLLNATLTVRQSEPLSHHGKGWEKFTDAAIRKLAEREDPVLFILWGKSAQEKCQHIVRESSYSQHKILTASHPSPFSAYKGFFGCRPFSQANAWLTSQGKSPIDWKIS